MLAFEHVVGPRPQALPKASRSSTSEQCPRQKLLVKYELYYRKEKSFWLAVGIKTKAKTKTKPFAPCTHALCGVSVLQVELVVFVPI